MPNKRYIMLAPKQCDELIDVMDFIISSSKRRDWKRDANNIKRELERHRFSNSIEMYQLIVTERQAKILGDVAEHFKLEGYSGKF